MKRTTPSKRLCRRPPACRNCCHFYITWEPRRPYGCRAMGFKSRRPPGVEVMRTTPGMICLHFAPRS